MTILDPSNLLVLVVSLGVAGLKVWALVDACLRPAPAYEANGKLSKLIWVGILLLAVLLSLGGVLSLFGAIGVVAAVVYLVDVRPALRGSRQPGPWG